ncbi:hypothetical protein [Geomicrobium sp. JCM 19037]|uniref:hypothetical protein n=1 Tax=Geomicrobium sp. JCM 19037 TaxID=1460634 RepID=UPI0006932F36|nr:hypothetical protein [Geomicrobium sp. JCM 19037]
MRETITLQEYLNAEKKGISRKLVQVRLRHGWSKDRALTQEKREFSNVFDEWVKSTNGISYKTFHKRRERGMDADLAGTKPVRKMRA